MDHGKFAPKCLELWNLVWNDASLDELSRFLDPDPGLIEYLQQNKVYDEKDFTEWGNYDPPLHLTARQERVDYMRLFLGKYNFNKDARWI